MLAAGGPDEAPAEEPPADGTVEDVDVVGAEGGAGGKDEVLVEEDAGTSTSGSSSRRKAVVSRRPAKSTSRSSARTTSTVKKTTPTTKATAARVALAPATTAPAPPPPPPPPPPPGPPPVAGGDATWDKLAYCESGNTNDPGAPYYGYWQFSEATWQSLGETGLPNEQSRARQLAAAKRLQAARGWAPWPGCSRQLGLQ